MSEQLGLLFLVLFVFAAAACIYLSITMSHRVQMGINRWRNEERQALETQLKQLADADARMNRHPFIPRAPSPRAPRH
jgi:hypothetical protein